MSRIHKMLNDLNERGAGINAFVVNVDGKMQLIGYDDKGIVNFLSSPIDKMSFQESVKGGGVRYIASIGDHPTGETKAGGKSPPPSEPESEPTVDLGEPPEPEPEPDPEAVAKAEEKALTDSLKRGCFDDLDD